MFGKRTRDRLARIEDALGHIGAVLEKHGDALDVTTPGGLAVVNANSKDAKTAAESAFVGVQALASAATAKPGIPEVVKAVSAQTDALRAMEATVRTATGPQPALPDPPVTRPDPVPAPAAPAAGKKPAGKQQ